MLIDWAPPLAHLDNLRSVSVFLMTVRLNLEFDWLADSLPTLITDGGLDALVLGGLEGLGLAGLAGLDGLLGLLGLARLERPVALEMVEGEDAGELPDPLDALEALEGVLDL